MAVRTLIIEAAYDADPDALFAKALSFDDMRETMRGLATYTGWPDGGTAQEGETYVADIMFWRLLPVTAHTMFVERADPVARELQTRDRHKGTRRWDHHRSVRDGRHPGEAVWTDTLVIDIGWQTPWAARFLAYTYRHPHHMRGGYGITTTIR